jgi:hypothetical protein
MGKHQKLLLKILSGNSDKNIPFSDLCSLLKYLQFDLRIKGDHHIFTRNDIEEILNLQPIKSLAKGYQIRQVRRVITKYKLAEFSDG